MGLPENTSDSRYFTSVIPENNEVTLEFDCAQAIVYLNGEASAVNLTNGILTLNLAFGEGTFIIPLN